MTPLFPPDETDAMYFSRADVHQDLGTFSHHAFRLDDHEWPSVEHYYQAMKFDDEAYRERIRQTDHPGQARKFGRSRWRKRRADWKLSLFVSTPRRTGPALVVRPTSSVHRQTFRTDPLSGSCFTFRNQHARHSQTTPCQSGCGKRSWCNLWHRHRNYLFSPAGSPRVHSASSKDATDQ